MEHTVALLLLVLAVVIDRGLHVSAYVGSTVHTFRIETEPPTYTYQTKYFDQRVDHFNFVNDTTFKQKYLINDTWWKTNNGPIFFYTGNEGDIEAFAQNSGFMWDIAPEFGAMLVFAEHRYYGTSLPFGPDSVKPGEPAMNGYLTSEQALADYAELLTYLKGNIKGAANSPVIAFGGSYGGMLAAWFRIKFPHICDGAIAASAPVAQFDTPCDAFNRIVTADYTAANETCSDVIRKSWQAIDQVSVDDDGMKWISDEFGLCDPITSAENVTALKDYLTDTYVNIAMMDYPYPTSFLAPLPGFPVQETCKRLVEAGREVPAAAAADSGNSTSAGDAAAATTLDNSTTTAAPLPLNRTLIRQVAAGVSVFYNYTGDAKCLNLSHTDDIGADMWDYQACTEMVMPMCSDGVNDMFQASSWNYTEYAEGCQTRWGVTPRQHMAEVMYGLKKLQGASNIVFSNGLLDPWSSGGILKNINPSVVALLIPEGAHHLDLRGHNIADPQSVFIVRKVEKEHIAKWIDSAYLRLKSKTRSKQTGPDLDNILPTIR